MAHGFHYRCAFILVLFSCLIPQACSRPEKEGTGTFYAYCTCHRPIRDWYGPNRQTLAEAEADAIRHRRIEGHWPTTVKIKAQP